ncbi:MAG TPA: hypothetical protein VFQ35_26210 [Polyangiaceae bacterium]|nr:hypothetical protein [Polyangiaceae bacterium]
MATETASLQSSPARARRGFETTAGEKGALSVALWGDLGLGWFRRFASAMARRGISIKSAAGTRDGDESWSARIELEVENASVDPKSLNYLALTEEGDGDPLELPPIDRFRIERTETAAICLRVFAKDRVGLLSALLDRMQFLGLFPVRLRVTTDGPVVDDTIWLKGVADHPPSMEAERALVALLQQLSSSSGEPR